MLRITCEIGHFHPCPPRWVMCSCDLSGLDFRMQVTCTSGIGAYSPWWRSVQDYMQRIRNAQDVTYRFDCQRHLESIDGENFSSSSLLLAALGKSCCCAGKPLFRYLQPTTGRTWEPRDCHSHHGRHPS